MRTIEKHIGMLEQLCSNIDLVMALEMARAANSPVFVSSATNFFAMTLFRAATGRCSLLTKNFCFLQSFII